MQAMMLRDERQESEVIPQRIRRLLRERHAMHVGELGLRLGLSREALNVCLGSLLAAGEIERLRPMAYEAEDHDFYRLRGGRASAVLAPSRRVDSESVRLAREGMMCAFA